VKSQLDKHACKCGKKAVVGLNGEWLCLKCFDKAMDDIDKTIRKIKKLA